MLVWSNSTVSSVSGKVITNIGISYGVMVVGLNYKLFINNLICKIKIIYVVEFINITMKR